MVQTSDEHAVAKEDVKQLNEKSDVDDWSLISLLMFVKVWLILYKNMQNKLPVNLACPSART